MEEKNKKNINRRDFIKIVGISAATSTAILYGYSSKGTSSSSSVSGEGEIPTDKMTYRTSPTTGDRVSLLGVDEMSVDEYRKAAIDAVQQLSVDVGIPTKLEALKEEDLQFLAESAHADACAPGNPKDASVEDLKALFRKLM